jgi:hypothetical protein
VKPGVADPRARQDDVGEHLSKIGEPVQGESILLKLRRITIGRTNGVLTDMGGLCEQPRSENTCNRRGGVWLTDGSLSNRV